MKDEYSVDYSIPENEISFLKGMIREYYQPEIERLNGKNEELLTLYTTEREVKDYYKNIINELEKWLKDQRDYYYGNYYGGFTAYGSQCDDTLDKLQELKGSESNGR